MSKYNELCKKIPDLIHALNTVETKYGFQMKYIGEASAMLLLLKDILEEESNEK